MSVAERAIAAIRSRSRPGSLDAAAVDVHLHPDRPTALGTTVLQALRADGGWRTQFETGTSNGGLTAHPGGDRWRWESRLFGGAYDAAPTGERPVYGGLRTTDDPYGSAPRFGSAHLRLHASVLGRTTLCYPDSAFRPEAVGTLDRAGAVVEAMRTPMADPLDRYVEAHVHGGLRLERDVAAVVLDPCFRGSDVEAAAELLRERAGTRVEWHHGFRLHADELAAHSAHRGPQVVAVGLEVAQRLTGDGWLDPAVIGRAVADGRWDPQDLKRVWHCVARFGVRDAARSGRRP